MIELQPRPLADYNGDIGDSGLCALGGGTFHRCRRATLVRIDFRADVVPYHLHH